MEMISRVICLLFLLASCSTQPKPIRIPNPAFSNDRLRIEIAEMDPFLDPPKENLFFAQGPIILQEPYIIIKTEKGFRKINMRDRSAIVTSLDTGHRGGISDLRLPLDTSFHP